MKLIQGLLHKMPYEANLDAVEVFIASYPRSGQGWFRCMLADYLYGGIDLSNVQDYLPGLGDELWTNMIVKHKIIGSHATPKIKKRLSAKMIYLYRNRDDVLVSYRRAFNERYNKNIGLDAFSDYMDRWYSYPMPYAKFRKGWLGAYTIEYPFTVGDMAKVIGYLGYELDMDGLRKVYNKFSKDNMRKMQSKINPKNRAVT
jgi:hypothetical protein